MTATFINSFILLFVAIDTIGNLPFFLSLTEEAKIKKIAGISLELFQFEFLVISIRWSRVGQVRLLTTDRDQRWIPITADNCDPASDKCRL